MALDYFRIGKGVDIDETVQVLYGSADPSAASGVVAGIGSLYMRTTGEVWHKSGAGDTAWAMLVDSAGSSVEDGYQNTFMGKTAVGSELPAYTSENVIADNDNLVEALQKLDAEIGAGVTPVVRTYQPTSDQAINSNIEALDAAIGTDAQHTSVSFTLVNESLKTSISKLDNALANSEPFKKSESAVETPSAYVMDSVAVASISTVEWLVTIRSNGTPANRKTYKIIAVNDGTVTNIDWTRYAVLKVGSSISGLSVDVSGLTGNMRLTVTSTEDIDYNLSRITLA